MSDKMDLVEESTPTRSPWLTPSLPSPSEGTGAVVGPRSDSSARLGWGRGRRPRPPTAEESNRMWPFRPPRRFIKRDDDNGKEEECISRSEAKKPQDTPSDVESMNLVAADKPEPDCNKGEILKEDAASNMPLYCFELPGSCPEVSKPKPVTETKSQAQLHETKDKQEDTSSGNSLIHLMSDESPFGLMDMPDSQPKLMDCMQPSSLIDEELPEKAMTKEPSSSSLVKLSSEDIKQLEFILGISPPSSIETVVSANESAAIEQRPNKPYRFRREDIKVYLTHMKSIRRKLQDWVMIFQYMRKDRIITEKELLREMGRVDAIVKLKENAQKDCPLIDI